MNIAKYLIGVNNVLTAKVAKDALSLRRLLLPIENLYESVFDGTRVHHSTRVQLHSIYFMIFFVMRKIKSFLYVSL